MEVVVDSRRQVWGIHAGTDVAGPSRTKPDTPGRFYSARAAPTIARQGCYVIHSCATETGT